MDEPVFWVAAVAGHVMAYAVGYRHVFGWKDAARNVFQWLAVTFLLGLPATVIVGEILVGSPLLQRRAELCWCGEP